MYAHVFVAGTFDRIHKGHEALLTSAFREGENVIIGLTSDEFVKKYKAVHPSPFTAKNDKSTIHKSLFMIHPFAARKQQLLHWLEGNGYSQRTALIPIDDPYEPAASSREWDAIVVTPDNRTRGQEINARRVAKGLPPLALIDVPLVGAQDRKPISSTRIRNGDIDRDGRLVMPESLRPELQQPMGRLLTIEDDIETSVGHRVGNPMVTVGDMATKTLLDLGVVPFLAIIDGKVRRKPVDKLSDMLARFSHLEKVQSGPGYITEKATVLIKKLLLAKEDHIIFVDGEEDLLVLPAVANAPLGTVVYYGQPPIAPSWACGPVAEGLVEIEVTAAKQREAVALLGKFT